MVPKEELIARFWPKAFVEESNLKIRLSLAATSGASRTRPI
jgi:hypothetical protein